MREKNLTRICLATVIIGIMIMFFMNKEIEPKKVNIGEVSESDNYLSISGEITSFHVSKSGTTFLKVKDGTGEIDVVVFKDSIQNMPDLKIGDAVEIVGKCQKYKDKLEIIASKIQQKKVKRG